MAKEKNFEVNIIADLAIIQACVKLYPLLLKEKLSAFKEECLDLIEEEIDGKHN